MELLALKDKLLSEQEEYPMAFVVGNGINRYVNDGSYSWSDLLRELYKQCPIDSLYYPNSGGITETELFDVLCLKSKKNENEIKSQIVRLVQPALDKSKEDLYKNLLQKFESWNVPLLTTNFDKNIEKGLKKHLFRSSKRKFTWVYPWNVYTSNSESDLADSPQSGFGIWHINGSVEYPRSIRMGLSDYMNIVTYTRRYLHEFDDKDSFRGKDKNSWIGYSTWLHIFMNSSLCVFGLSLDENETYLRWLLIQRKKYLENIAQRSSPCYYICTNSDLENKDNKRFFLNSVGFEIVIANNPQEIYESFL
jgi:hypothetical protein